RGRPVGVEGLLGQGAGPVRLGGAGRRVARLQRLAGGRVGGAELGAAPRGALGADEHPPGGGGPRSGGGGSGHGESSLSSLRPAQSRPIGAAGSAAASGGGSLSGGRTGPAGRPTARIPALTMLTAYPRRRSRIRV